MQQAFDEPDRLPERDAEQALLRQAGLDGGIAAYLLSAAPARDRRIRVDLGVGPDNP